MKPTRGQTALVTGASSGIGAAFAAGLASRGLDVVIVARRENRLRRLAQEITARHDVQVRCLPFDLAQTDAGSALVSEVDRAASQIDLVVNCAGFASHGSVVDTDLKVIDDEIRLNCTTVADLSYLYGQRMSSRGSGAILNIASLMAFQSAPYMAIYAASKAFVLTFTEALAAELAERGVRVLAVCPGATETEFFDVAGEESVFPGPRRAPTQVVETALAALETPRAVVVDGSLNKIISIAPRLLTRSMMVKLTARTLRP